MRRPLWHRGFSALFAAWFALALAEPAALHSCPLHTGLAVQTGGHDAAGMHAHGAPRPAENHQQHTGCTCVGDCGGGSAPPDLPRTVDLPAPSLMRATRLVIPAATLSVAPLPPHSLPFANGPPHA